MGRVLLVLLILSWVGATWVVRRRRLIDAQQVRAGERLPARLRDSRARRTWVLVTSPWCAVCGPAEARLRELDPRSRIVVVDAVEQPSLARQLRVRGAPTLLLADRAGHVRHRLAGPKAVDGADHEGILATT